MICNGLQKRPDLRREMERAVDTTRCGRVCRVGAAGFSGPSIHFLARGPESGDRAAPPGRAKREPSRAPGKDGRARGGVPPLARRNVHYRFRLTSSCNISSLAVITRAFDWKPRCAMIMFVNSWARSTLDISSAPEVIIDFDPSPTKPSTAAPEFAETWYMLSPTRISPVGLLKSASTIWASVSVTPLLKEPLMTPYWSMLMFCSSPMV